MLTPKTLTEEIWCGNIEDESMTIRALAAREVAPGVFEFPGRCEMPTSNERSGFEIPEDDSYQTIAGYIP